MKTAKLRDLDDDHVRTVESAMCLWEALNEVTCSGRVNNLKLTEVRARLALHGVHEELSRLFAVLPGHDFTPAGIAAQQQ